MTAQLLNSDLYEPPSYLLKTIWPAPFSSSSSHRVLYNVFTTHNSLFYEIKRLGKRAGEVQGVRGTCLQAWRNFDFQDPHGGLPEVVLWPVSEHMVNKVC